MCVHFEAHSILSSFKFFIMYIIICNNYNNNKYNKDLRPTLITLTLDLCPPASPQFTGQ